MRLAIVDDQQILREGLKMILEEQEGYEVVGLYGDGEKILEDFSVIMPDVILMDVKMPILNGVEATRRIKALDKRVKILILTTFNEEEFIYDALKNGASGYILKESTPEEILEAIETVYRGEAMIQPKVAMKLINQFARQEVLGKEEAPLDLTDRELEIVKAIGAGYNNKEIAAHLFMSEGTVKNHITKILLKLDLRDRTQLAIFAVKRGL